MKVIGIKCSMNAAVLASLDILRGPYLHTHVKKQPAFEAGASIPLRQQCIFPLFQISPGFRKNFGLRGEFPQFDLFPENFPIFIRENYSFTTNFKFPPYFPSFNSFPPCFGKFFFFPTFAKFPPISLNFRVFTYFSLRVFSPTFTMMHLCITQCTYWTSLP